MGLKYNSIFGWLDGQPYPPCYSTDIAAAWQVVETLARSNLSVQVRYHNGRLAEVIFYEDPTNPDFVEYGYVSSKESNPVPHAICLAALKALGVK
jgi:hypothetical protein